MWDGSRPIRPSEHRRCSILLTSPEVVSQGVAVLARERHDLIVDRVRTEGSVRVRELADLMGVSDMTIRRDLDALTARGLIDKVHGGAVRLVERTTHEPGFEAKRNRQKAEKNAIARAAAELVRPGISIGLNGGTTTWALAALLVDVPELTVVTNSPSAASIFHRAERADLTVVLTGGVRTPSDALVGPIATSGLKSLSVDLLFLGVHGIDPQFGFSTPNLAEAETNRVFCDQARSLVVLADHTKWGNRGLSTIAPLTAADTLVSDTDLPADAIECCHDAGVEVRLAPADDDATTLPRTRTA